MGNLKGRGDIGTIDNCPSDFCHEVVWSERRVS